MGLEKDLPPGEQLLALFRPFLEHLAASDLSPKTIQKHVDNMWALGGEFIRDLHSDSSLRKKPVELVLRQMIEYGGPLLYHGGEDQQRSFDSTFPRRRSRNMSITCGHWAGSSSAISTAILLCERSQWSWSSARSSSTAGPSSITAAKIWQEDDSIPRAAGFTGSSPRLLADARRHRTFPRLEA